MNSFGEFWKGRKTVKGVLILNAFFPGLGLLYAGGWTLALAPFWLMLVVGWLLTQSFLSTWLTAWFWTSLLGSVIVVVKRIKLQSDLQTPGPNTRNLADSFGVGHGKGESIAALDTLEQKVMKADEMLKATRALELEKSKPKPKTEKYDLAEPTPLVEQRPPSLAREVPHFKVEQDRANPVENQDRLYLKTPETASESAPHAEAKPSELRSKFVQPEPLSTDYNSTFAKPEQSSTDFNSTFANPADSHLSEFKFDFGTPSVPRKTQDSPPEPTSDQSLDFGSPSASEQTSALTKSEFHPDILDFNASDSPDMGAPPSISSDFSPPNDLPFSQPAIPKDPHKNDGLPADAKFALDGVQTPEQIQQFFDKLGETVGTSYQQEPLSKPSFDISFPSFESPNFSFDFSSALSSDFSSMSGKKPESDESAPPTDSCQRCGVAKHADFTFCLGCGISF